MRSSSPNRRSYMTVHSFPITCSSAECRRSSAMHASPETLRKTLACTLAPAHRASLANYVAHRKNTYPFLPDHANSAPNKSNIKQSLLQNADIVSNGRTLSSSSMSSFSFSDQEDSEAEMDTSGPLCAANPSSRKMRTVSNQLAEEVFSTACKPSSQRSVSEGSLNQTPLSMSFPPVYQRKRSNTTCGTLSARSDFPDLNPEQQNNRAAHVTPAKAASRSSAGKGFVEGGENEKTPVGNDVPRVTIIHSEPRLSQSMSSLQASEFPSSSDKMLVVANSDRDTSYGSRAPLGALTGHREVIGLPQKTRRISFAAGEEHLYHQGLLNSFLTPSQEERSLYPQRIPLSPVQENLLEDLLEEFQSQLTFSANSSETMVCNKCERETTNETSGNGPLTTHKTSLQHPSEKTSETFNSALNTLLSNHMHLSETRLANQNTLQPQEYLVSEPLTFAPIGCFLYKIMNGRSHPLYQNSCMSDQGDQNPLSNINCSLSKERENGHVSENEKIKLEDLSTLLNTFASAPTIEESWRALLKLMTKHCQAMSDAQQSAICKRTLFKTTLQEETFNNKQKPVSVDSRSCTDCVSDAHITSLQKSASFSKLQQGHDLYGRRPSAVHGQEVTSARLDSENDCSLLETAQTEKHAPDGVVIPQPFDDIFVPLTTGSQAEVAADFLLFAICVTKAFSLSQTMAAHPTTGEST